MVRLIGKRLRALLTDSPPVLLKRMGGSFDVDTGLSRKVQICRPPLPKRSYRRGMGGDQGDFLGIHHFDGGSAGNGQCLFLSGEDWLPLAVSPQGFRPLGNGEMVVRSVSRRWNLGGSVQPLDPGRAPGSRPCE